MSHQKAVQGFCRAQTAHTEISVCAALAGVCSGSRTVGPVLRLADRARRCSGRPRHQTDRWTPLRLRSAFSRCSQARPLDSAIGFQIYSISACRGVDRCTRDVERWLGRSLPRCASVGMPCTQRSARSSARGMCVAAPHAVRDWPPMCLLRGSSRSIGACILASSVALRIRWSQSLSWRRLSMCTCILCADVLRVRTYIDLHRGSKTVYRLCDGLLYDQR